MSDSVAVSPSDSTIALSQGQRLVNTFIAPTKTFNDIRRNASWWLPWLIAVVVGIGFTAAVTQKVGWDKVYENILRQNPKQMERMQQAQPEQAAQIRSIGAKTTQYTAYATPVLSLLFAAITAGILLATVNFGFGGHAKFAQMFAVYFYATLPLVLSALLAVIALYAGLDADSFNLQNPVGTNIGYYLQADAPRWLVVLASSIDVFSIWTAVLLTLGCAAVAQIKKSSAAIAVFGWWILIILIKTGTAAI